MNPSTSLLLCLCPLNAVAVLRGPVLLKEISTSQLKGLIKPTTRAKERHNRSIQQLRLAPLTHGFCLTQGWGVVPLPDLWVCFAVFGCFGSSEASASGAFVFVCVFGGFDWQQLWESSEEGMILCAYASSLTRSRNACTHKKKMQV